MRERLKKLMAEQFQLGPGAIPDDAQFNALPGWDSLGHIALMMAVEAEWGVALTAEAMQNALTLPAIEDFVQSALKDKEASTKP